MQCGSLKNEEHLQRKMHIVCAVGGKVISAESKLAFLYQFVKLFFINKLSKSRK